MFCPHWIYVFCIYLRTNSDLCHFQHKLIGVIGWSPGILGAESSKYFWSVSRAFTVWLQAEHGDEIDFAIMQSVRLRDRQLDVDCQWCFTVEGTDCYCILYILTVTVYITIYHISSSQLATTRSTQECTGVCKYCWHIILWASKTSHRCPSHSFLLRREVCVNVKSVFVHTPVRTRTDGWLCVSSCTVLYFQRDTC
jgi:hypothetical protein